MKSESRKQLQDENTASGRSLKKYLAVAAMAASLGVSLGVSVIDAVAGDGPASPPSYTKQGTTNSMPEKSKISSQAEETKKIGSKQFKESNQIKLKQKVETKADQSQVSR